MVRFHLELVKADTRPRGGGWHLIVQPALESPTLPARTLAVTYSTIKGAIAAARTVVGALPAGTCTAIMVRHSPGDSETVWRFGMEPFPVDAPVAPQKRA